MKFLSVCSGIEAASAAWEPLGWKAVAFSEIDPFPCAVLKHHYPDVPNWGDMTKWKEWPNADVDVLVGGTPCQSFSVAGLREGLDDPRGNLMLVLASIARRYRPAWVVWENVPGVLSSEQGRDFGSLLGLLSGRAVETPVDGWKNSGVLPGIPSAYGLAWRVLDAQFFGVPQRRRRVFVIGHLGDWRAAAAVLFERASMRGDPAPRREARKGPPAGTVRSTQGGSDVDHGRAGHLVAETVEARHAGGFQSTDSASRGHLIASDVAPTLSGSGNRTGGDRPPGTQVETAESLVVMSSGQANAEISENGVAPALTYLHETQIIAFDETQMTHPANHSVPKPGDPCHPLAKGARPPAIAFTQNQREEVRELEVAGSLEGEPGSHQRTYLAFDCKRGGDADEVAPPLRALDNPNSHLSGGGHIAVAFKASHYTRGKDGAPAQIAPPLSADADKGDQDPLVFEARYFTRDNKTGGAPAHTAQLSATGAAKAGDAAPLVFTEQSFRTEVSPTLVSGEKGGGKNAINHPHVAVAGTVSAEHGRNRGLGQENEGDMVVAFQHLNGGKARTMGQAEEVSPTLNKNEPSVHSGMQVRRLTPRECERLQDFADDYTLIQYRGKPAADGPRYKALGNSMARCVMVWLGKRIDMVAAVLAESKP